MDLNVKFNFSPKKSVEGFLKIFKGVEKTTKGLIVKRDNATVSAGYNATVELKGKNSLALLGRNSKIKAVLGAWIVLTEWEQDKEYEWNIKLVKTAQIDGKKLKENVYYKLEGGEFIETE